MSTKASCQPSAVTIRRKIGRREFLRLAGLSGAAALASACVSPTPVTAPPAATPQVIEKPVEVTRVVTEEVVKVATATPAPTTAPAPAKAARTVLRLQSSFPVDYPNTLVMSGEVFDDFKQTHPDFTVEVNFVDVPDVASSFVKALAVGQAPDFFYAFESQGTLAYGNHLYDLTDFIKGLNLWDDIYQPAKDLWTIDGKFLGVPEYYGAKCYVYRSDIWEQVGLDPEKFPTTWEEFQNAAIKLTKKGERDGFSAYEDGALSFEYLISHIHQNEGGEYETADVLAPAAINKPEAKEAFTWFVDLVRKYKVMSKEGSVAPAGAQTLLDGYAGVEYQGPWWVPQRRAVRPELFDQGLIRVGAPLTRKVQLGHLDASGWGVNVHTEILPDVLDFVKTFLKDEHYSHYFDATSADGQTVFRQPSGRRSINENPNFWIAKEPLISQTAFLKAFDMGMSTARTHLGFNEVRNYVYPRMCEQAIYEVKDDQAILDAAAAQMDAITNRTRAELE